MVLELSKAGKCYSPDRWIFRGLNFSLARGAAVAILGVSGSGKTTLLKTLAGLEPLDEGIRRDPAGADHRLGMLFQQNALFDSLTALENLTLPLREVLRVTGREARTRALGWLEAVGLSHAVDLRPESLSGGMQKRLGIARALIVDPDTVLFDEPTAGLDPITSRSIASLIRSLQTRGKLTSITVTSELPTAVEASDEVYLLAGGKLVSAGKSANLAQTSDPAVRQFVLGETKGPLVSFI